MALATKFSLTSNLSLKGRMKLQNLTRIITLPSVTNDQKGVCDNDLTDKQLFDALKGIPDNKSPGNDWLTKEFYETFLDEL